MEQGGRLFDIFMINLDGTGLEQITHSGTFDAFPMFSFDGKKLVFASNRRVDRQPSRETNVFVADWVE
jgi:Tol biopolymer transport system component